MRNLLTKGHIKADRVLVFDYPLDERKNHSVPGRNAEIRFSLPDKIFKKKREMVHELYGFRKNSFEFRSSSKVEAFNVLK